VNVGLLYNIVLTATSLLLTYYQSRTRLRLLTWPAFWQYRLHEYNVEYLFTFIKGNASMKNMYIYNIHPVKTVQNNRIQESPVREANSVTHCL